MVPGFGVSTKDAFGWWDKSSRRATRGANDLQSVVARHHPVVNRLVAALKEEGAFHASLSGSGSAVFGLFSRRSEAQEAARALAGPRTFVTPTLSRRECQRLAAK